MKLLFLFLLPLCGMMNPVNAQSYELITVTNEPFVFLENVQSAFDGAWNIPEFQVPLGFNFEFFDIMSDQLYSYGFGGEFGLRPYSPHLYEVVPFYASMIDRGYQQDSALSPISYTTEGIEGQRIFTLEMKEAGLYYGLETENGVFLDYISFQLRLYEGSGDIEYHLGPYSILEDPEIVFDGEVGPGVGLLVDAENSAGGYIGEIILLSGDALDPIVVTDTIAYLNWPIPENTVHRFSRMGTAVDDQLSSARQPLLVPNPTSEELRLNGINAGDVVFPIVVVDAQARQVEVWRTEEEISAVDLGAGVYYAAVRTKDNIQTEKIIVIL